ncbi:uncharacterized protein [Aquarana catesbeiana]|uniref:uncharacterized protein n=1 Tax=Aquarana catesbeiana TaxID=8400 RepID=UPI003CC9CB70
MMELLCKQYTNELTLVDKEIEKLYEDNQLITLDGLFSTRESALKTNLEGYVTEILKTKERKFVRDKLAYDNKQAYHWDQKNNKAKRRNNQTRNPKQPISEPNDSDSSVSPVSSFQAQDMRSTRTQEAAKYTKENASTGTVRRTPSTKAPMVTRASMAKNSSAHAPAEQLSILKLGLTFCPVQKVDQFELIKDINLFSRKLMFKILYDKSDIPINDRALANPAWEGMTISDIKAMEELMELWEEGVILGIPWLQAHNPQINWASGNVEFLSGYCLQHCLQGTGREVAQLLCLHPDVDLLQAIPEPYQDFADVFSKKGAELLPPHRPYDCPIELLPGTEVPFGRIFPLTEQELGTLKQYLDENLKKKFIRPSTSPAGAGLFFVEKKDHSLRPCIDYRELNKITIKNRYPLPLVPELFQRLGTARIFTKLDLRGAYNLIRIREGDEWKTAFRTRFGHFEYQVMPFGLCNAPATFQHFVNDIFRDILDLYVIVYLDDILIFSSSLADHRRHVRNVLVRLRQHGLYAKLDKCEFERQSIQFLGLIISVEGIKMDPQKVSAILDWPAPTDKKGVQRFVGFSNFYRKFIKDFSKIIAPITELTKQGARFCWSSQAQAAFEKLKGLFTSASILKHPDPALPFVLEVDASEIAVGAVLSQRQGPKALLFPVAFFSRKLSSSERNYDVGDRELLAIKAALEEWRYLLEGAVHPVLIFTDHKNLEYLRAAKRLRPRQARWALFFSRFSFHITYRPGSKNGKPDALSRMFHDSKESTPPDTILPAGSFLLLQGDLISRIKQASSEIPLPTGTSLNDGLLWHEGKIFVPERCRVLVLELCHDHKLAGHFGARKTSELNSEESQDRFKKSAQEIAETHIKRDQGQFEAPKRSYVEVVKSSSPPKQRKAKPNPVDKKKNLEKAGVSNTTYYDLKTTKKEYETGDKVYLYNFAQNQAQFPTHTYSRTNNESTVKVEGPGSILDGNRDKFDIINLSSHPLTEDETTLLELGLTFCPDEEANKFELIKDLHLFARHLMYKVLYDKNPNDVEITNSDNANLEGVTFENL